MNIIPSIAFSAWSGTGKTTIIEKLIESLKLRGFRVAVIKHDAHDFEIDREGKDSFRFTQAGADMTIIASEKKTALIEQRSHNLQDIMAMVHDVDLIILEGYNNESVKRIGVARKETGKGFRTDIRECVALVTDLSPEDISSSMDALPPIFQLEDTEGLTDFIVNHIIPKN